MRSAPSVTYPVRPVPRARLLLMVIWAWGAGGVALWCYQVDSMAGRQGVALAAVALAGLGAVWAAWRTRPGTLHWDGQHWSFETSGQGVSTAGASSAAVALDFQSFLLLRLAQGRRVSWLWLDRRACPERWRDVRRAVHARAAADGSLVAPPMGAGAGAAGPAR